MTTAYHSLVSNRKARHSYEILDTFEAGIVLRGTEIKSLRSHEASLQESYVKIIDRELFLLGSYIKAYSFGNIHNHPERRDRKLLMHSKEINKLHAAVQEKGLTLVALELYIKNGKVKVKLATAKGKKLYDKREDIKSRDEERKMQSALKNYR